MAVNSLPQILTVSELAYLLKASIEETFGSLRLRGEVTGLKRHTSGHLYYRLKDMEAVIDAVSWRGTLGKWISQLEDGMEVICTGRITTYPGGSRYQIIVEAVELAGEGALLKILEQRKKALAAEGLFAEERKQALPFLPATLGVITSPTGAVIRDILHRLSERFPCHVLVWPVAVQGEGAAQQVARAIEGFNNLPSTSLVPLPDILIVARGGGALEDLWAFNEEGVVRAIAASRIPVITAIGHETDITLADFAADRRAPTPTAAAEIAVPVRLELIAKLQSLTQRLVVGLKNHLDDKNLKLTALAERVPPPSRWLEAKTLRLDDWTERLRIAGASYIQHHHHFLRSFSHRLKHPQEMLINLSHQLNAFDLKLHALLYHKIVAPFESRLTLASKLLENLSYRCVLERGFALVTTVKGKPIASVSQAMAATKLNLHFAEGKLQVAPIKENLPDVKKAPLSQINLFEGE